MLDESKHALDRILTDYEFAKLCRCGRSTCGRWHKIGVLARTVDGLETSVGHVCGRKLFGKQAFELATAAYARERETEQLLDRIAEVESNAVVLIKRVEELQPARYGIAWVVKVRIALSQVLGRDLYEYLSIAEKRGDLEVKEVRQRTRPEIDNLVALTRQRREQLKEEVTRLGSLRSMPWIACNFSGLQTNVVEPLVSLQWKDVDNLSLEQLRKEVKQVADVQATVAEAEAACCSAQVFFEQENLALLARWVPERSQAIRQRVGEWVRSAACRELSEGLTQ